MNNKEKKQVEALEVLQPETNKEEIKSVEGLFPKWMKTNEVKNEIYKIKKSEEKIKRKDLKYETNKYVYDFQQFETIRSFGESIYTGKTNINQTEMDQTNLLENIIEFNNKSKPKIKEGQDKNEILLTVKVLFMKDEN